jgi:hypothetical protein
MIDIHSLTNPLFKIHSIRRYKENQLVSGLHYRSEHSPKLLTYKPKNPIINKSEQFESLIEQTNIVIEMNKSAIIDI